MRLATSSLDNFVWVWDLETGESCAKLQGHTGKVWTVAFCPKGMYLATGGEDKAIWLWDVANWACLTKLEGHTERVYSVAFNFDGTLLASGSRGGSEDESVRIWNVGN